MTQDHVTLMFVVCVLVFVERKIKAANFLDMHFSFQVSRQFLNFIVCTFEQIYQLTMISRG